MKHEDSYVEFLNKKQVKMQEHKSYDNAIEIETLKERIQNEMK